MYKAKEIGKGKLLSYASNGNLVGERFLIRRQVNSSRERNFIEDIHKGYSRPS